MTQNHRTQGDVERFVDPFDAYGVTGLNDNLPERADMPRIMDESVSATESVAPTFDARDDVYVWTARKDGTGRPVAYSGPHNDQDAMRVVRQYPGSLAQIVVYLAPAEHEPYVRAAIIGYANRAS